MGILWIILMVLLRDCCALACAGAQQSVWIYSHGGFLASRDHFSRRSLAKPSAGIGPTNNSIF